ncbi:major facilitator superfamily MFS_1 [Sulfolobus islandicus L.S.2.15]|uniref:Major facilitator superfamily MFS_1 n=1 Tax=Saccharolobus islandicus (strain L.S.2.15 / Lassen \|nr:MFS transporter [Sulfolobus islandicus]ACP35707.1 major facilitator superfamily MFS_1 [Sulfolobus islandicus L.S.2.15]
MKDKIIFSINIIRFSSLTAIWAYTGIALYDFYHLSTLLVIVFYSLGFPILVTSHILAGHLTDRIGTKNTIIVSLFLTSIILFLGFFLTSGVCGIIILSIQAFLNSLYVTSSSTATGNLSFPSVKDLLLSFSRFSAGTNLGWVIGPIIGGLLYYYVGWKYILLLGSLGNLISIPIAYRLNNTENINNFNRKYLIRPSKYLMEIIIVQFIFAFVGSQILFGFTVYSTNILKISSLLIGYFISLNSLINALFQEPIGRHMTKLRLLSLKYMYILGSFIFSMSCLSILYFKNIVGLLIFIIFVSLGEIILNPIILSVSYIISFKYHNKEIGMAMGYTRMANGLGRAFSTSTVAYLFSIHSYELSFTLISLIGIIGLTTNRVIYISLEN